MTKQLIFAEAFRLITDYSFVGHCELRDNGDCYWNQFGFSAADNLPAWRATVPHPQLPGFPPPGPFLIPHSRFSQYRGTWIESGDTITVMIGLTTRVYTQGFGERVYRLKSQIVGSNSTGFAFVADDYRRIGAPVTIDDLANAYRGVYVGTVNGEWAAPFDNALSVYAFTKFPPDRLGYYFNGVFSSVLMGYAPYSNCLVFFHGGHDFNNDKVFAGDGGHVKMGFAALDPVTGKIVGIAYAEQSYQFSGTSICGVGYYG